jgi:hypothetical protein
MPDPESRDMTAPLSETLIRDKYLAEANAELDAMLGEVGELEAPPAAPPGRSWVRLLVIAVIAVAVFAIGVLLLRGRRPTRMALNVMR